MAAFIFSALVLGAFAASNTTMGRKLIERNYVKNILFAHGSHKKYPVGAETWGIDGNVDQNYQQAGNPEPRNPMRELFTYPDKQSYLINKDQGPGWMTSGVIDKKRQWDQIQDKLNCEDFHILLTPQYKQLDGSTVNPMPKIYFPNIYGEGNRLEWAAKKIDGLQR